MVTANLPVIPKGFRLKTVTINGTPTTAMVEKTSRIKKFKTSLAVRQRISAGLRKIKVPVLTVAAQVPWAVPAAGWLFKGLTTPNRPDMLVLAGDSALSAFTGVRLIPRAAGSFDFDVKFDHTQLIRGLVPNGMVWLINKSGVLRSTNQKLAKTRLPFRLN